MVNNFFLKSVFIEISQDMSLSGFTKKTGP